MNSPEMPAPAGVPVARPPIGNALDAVKLPGILLIVLGGLMLLVALFTFVGQLVGEFSGANDARLATLTSNPDTNPVVRGAILTAMKSMVVLAAAWVVGGALTVFGGISMVQLRRFRVAVAGAIIPMVPLLGSYPCCIALGLPLGVWALVVLMKPEVKASFT